MLVCSVSQLARRAAIAADLAEIATAADQPGTGNVVFATLVDDPASVNDFVDAYLGEIMLEAASAADLLSASIPAVVAADVAEAASAADSAAVVTSWSPSQLTTLKLWLKGDSNAGANGSAITTWTDASGTGYNATGVNGPTVAAANLNGLNTVRCTSAPTPSGQYFSLPNFLTGFTAGSVIFIVKLVADPTVAGADAGVTKFGGDISNPNLYGYTGNNNMYDDFGSTARRLIGDPAIDLAGWHMTSLHAASNDMRVYINGTSFYTTASNTVAWDASPMIARCMNGANQDYCNCWIAELIFVNEVLSTSDRQKLEGYLAWKWGIQSILPAGHPYQSAPPPP